MNSFIASFSWPVILPYYQNPPKVLPDYQASPTSLTLSLDLIHLVMKSASLKIAIILLGILAMLVALATANPA
jgi:hypothetical protein